LHIAATEPIPTAAAGPGQFRPAAAWRPVGWAWSGLRSHQRACVYRLARDRMTVPPRCRAGGLGPFPGAVACRGGLGTCSACRALGLVGRGGVAWLSW